MTIWDRRDKVVTSKPIGRLRHLGISTATDAGRTNRVLSMQNSPEIPQDFRRRENEGVDSMLKDVEFDPLREMLEGLHIKCDHCHKVECECSDADVMADIGDQ